jgi:alkyldihydroxyacetonephosphate synthase
LFYPFMNNSFYFQSELKAPPQLNGQRYLLSCVAAAQRFVKKSDERFKRHSQSGYVDTTDDFASLSRFTVSKRKTTNGIPLFCWAVSQPRGNFAARFVGWLLALILQRCFSEVTVDLKSFSAMQRVRQANGAPALILVPTHRSIFDFLLLSFVCFSVPELQIQLPHIAAADIFERLPFIGWLLPSLGAFFVRRGRMSLDSCLFDTVSSVKEKASETVVEVFIEGTRSRDRRFLSPKTGVLRCLQDPAKEQIVVPIAISYERIAEQESFVSEVSGGQPSTVNVGAMLSWFVVSPSPMSSMLNFYISHMCLFYSQSALRGKVHLGRVHIVACEPLPLKGDTDLNALVNEVQKRQAKATFISDYHVRASSDFLGLESLTVRMAFDALGIKFSPNHFSLVEKADPSNNISVLLQVSPFLAPLFTTTRPKWSKWMCPFSLVAEGFPEEPSKNSDVAKLTDALLIHFDAADRCVDAAFQTLNENGFLRPQRHHVLQAARQLNSNVPALLLRAAIDIRWSDQGILAPVQNAKQKRGTLGAPTKARVGSDEALGYWGYHDAQFVLQVDAHGRTAVRFEEGNRRTAPSRKKNETCSGLLPFIAKETGIPVNPLNVAFSGSNNNSNHKIPSCRIQGAEFEALKEAIANLAVSDADRIRHGTGHSQDDVFRIRSQGYSSLLRVPDVVVWPLSETEVETLIRLAQVHHWCIIPYGGGTNVSNALQCPSLETEPRPIISLDMRRMCRIRHIDEDNQVAHIEAGITGRHLEAQLASRGYTLGHAPDSLEFSTLGGWIATKASGMKRNKYGNIEDIVIGVRMVGPNGLLHHGSDRHVWGRESSGGMELKNLVLGSEGCLGVITSAIVRIWPLPKAQDYDGILLSDFEEGLRFVRELSKLDASSYIPVSVRLLDNDHFRLGMALRPDDDSVLTSLAHWCGKEMLKWYGRFDEMSVVCVTLVFEGSVEEVARQKRAVQRLRFRYGGVSLGSARGKAGYDLTFRIAYLRDFALSYHFLSDSFETFAPWSQISTIVARTKAVLRQEHARRCLPGQPFIGCRVTQLYHEGACLYFYFCMNFEGVDRANEVFSAIEHVARQEILLLGGSLSHHHGVGKIRSSFLKEIDSVPFQETLCNIKRSIDPDNIFGARNGSFTSRGRNEVSLFTT